jgi:hypothetical protein
MFRQPKSSNFHTAFISPPTVGARAMVGQGKKNIFAAFGGVVGL